MHSTSDDSPRFTLDSNVLVYSVDGRAGIRHQLALEIVRRAAQTECWLTLQSLSEFYAAVTRKAMLRAADAAAQVIDWMTIFRCIPASSDAIRVALTHSVAARASYWDALLVATAGQAGCTLILSEDMADGSTLSGVEIHNPFASGGRLTARARRLLEL
jgi:predicted nucleic acid-binding protein